MTAPAMATSAAGPAPAPAPGTPVSPFVGPVALREGQPLFGRGDELVHLADLLVSRRVVLLYSPSGAGKTSLLAAGLLPFLREQRARTFRPTPLLRVNHQPQNVPAGTSFNRYVVSILRGLEDLRPREEQLSDATLATMTLSRYLAERWPPEAGGDDAPVDLLVFDQFEEVFTLDPVDCDGKRELFRQLGEAIGSSHRDVGDASAPPRWALFSMREDHTAELDEYRPLVPTGLAASFRLNLLSREQAAQAIVGPAQGCGVRIDPEATKLLVEDLVRVRVRGADGVETWAPGPFVEPVQLQVVLLRVWQRVVGQGAREIGPGDLEHEGLGTQVDRALAEFYDDAVATAVPTATAAGVRERAVRDWFERALITPAHVRSQVLRDDGDPARSLPGRVVDALAAAHVIRIERRAGRDWIELTHDRLIEPVLAANTAWRAANLSFVERQAELWDESRRAEDFLLTASAYRDAERWARQNAHAAEPRVVAFLDACRRGRRRARLARWSFWALAAAFVVCVVFFARSHLVNIQLQVANEVATAQAELGEIRRALASARLHVAYDRPLSVELARAQDERARAARGTLEACISSHLERNALAWRFLDWVKQRPPPVRRLLAVRDKLPDPTGAALDLAAESESANAILIDALRSSPRQRWTYPLANIRPAVTGTSLPAVAIGQDLKTVATVTADSHIAVEDATGAAPPRVAPLAGARGIAYDSRARLVAAVGDGDRIEVWRVQKDGLERIATLNDGHHRRVSRVTALAVGSRDLVSAAGASNEVAVWSVRAAAPLALVQPVTPIYALAFDREGQRLAGGDWEGRVFVWTGFRDGSPVRRDYAVGPDAEDTVAFYSVAFDRSGTLVAGGGHDGSVVLWSGSSPTPLARLRGSDGHYREVTSVRFVDDAPRPTLASGSTDGSVILWNVPVAGWTGGRDLPISWRVFALGDAVRAVAADAETAIFATDQSVAALHATGPASPLALTLDGSCEGRPQGASRRAGRWGPVVFAPEGTVVLAACGDEVRGWSLDESAATPFATAIVHPRLARLASDARARLVVTVSSATATAWRRSDAGRFDPAPLPDVPGRHAAVAVDPAGHWIAIAGRDGVTVWDASGSPPRPYAVVRPEATSVRALAFSPEGHHLVAAGERALFEWSIGSGSSPSLESTAPTPGQVNVIAFGPDGDALYSGDDQGQVLRWPLPLATPAPAVGSERGVVAAAVGRPAAPVTARRGSRRAPPIRDETRIATSDGLGNVIIRRSANDEFHAVTLLDGKDARRYLACDASGDRVVVADENVILWDLRWKALRAAAGSGAWETTIDVPPGTRARPDGCADAAR